MAKTRYKLLFVAFSFFLCLSLLTLSIVMVLASPTQSASSNIGVNYVVPINLNFINNEGSEVSDTTTKVIYHDTLDKFRIDGIVPEVDESSSVSNLDSLTNSTSQEFYFFSSNQSWSLGVSVSPIYYVSTSEEPVWYSLPEAGEKLELYSIFLTPVTSGTSVILPHSTTMILSGQYNVTTASGGWFGSEKINSQAYNMRYILLPNSVTSIGLNAFRGGTGVNGLFVFSRYFGNYLNTLILPPSIERIESGAFTNCNKLQNIYVANLETYNQINFVSSSSVPYSKAMQKLGNWVSGVNFSFSNPNLIADNEVFSGEVSIDLEKVGPFLFYNYKNITSVSFSKNVETIGTSAFYGCSTLKNLNFEDGFNLQAISSSCFSGCNIDSILGKNGTYLTCQNNCLIETSSRTLILGSNNSSIPSDGSVTSIGSYAFSGCSDFTSITIPSTVTSIGTYAFSKCDGLSSITIPSGVTTIENYAFYDCGNIQELHIDNLTSYLNISYGNNYSSPLYSTNQAVSLYVGEEPITNLTIPSDLAAIPSYAFMNLNITSVTIPSSVTSVGNFAFSGCTGLTSVTISSSVTSVGSSAFSGCTGLTSVTIPSSVTSVGNFAFSGCSGLKSISFREASNLTSIGSYAFQDCISLSDVNFGALGKLTSIGDYTFDGCIGLTSITIPSSVTSIGNSAFDGCTGLTSITIPSSVTIIESYAFDGCSGLTSVTMPDNLTSIESGTFRDCSSLGSITIPSSVTSIGSSAFNGCTGLTSITIPSSVTSIGSSAFEDCTGLKSITIPRSVTIIESYAFDGCTGLTSVTIPSSVTSIGSNAFSGCSGLTINCEAASQPSGWDSDWNPDNRPVNWEYVIS